MPIKILQVFAILAWLPTQQSIAQSIPEPTTKRLECGFGPKIAPMLGQFFDLAGGQKYNAPNLGVDVYTRYNFIDPKISIRLKQSFERSGNRRLAGIYDQRSEVKSDMTVLGLMIRSPRGRPGYICIESGLAIWEINATFEPFVYFRTRKNVTAFLVGAETRHTYIEMGWQIFGFVKNQITIPENNYIHDIDNVGSSFVLSAGIRL